MEWFTTLQFHNLINAAVLAVILESIVHFDTLDSPTFIIHPMEIIPDAGNWTTHEIQIGTRESYKATRADINVVLHIPSQTQLILPIIIPVIN